jgi:hypothetical protein
VAHFTINSLIVGTHTILAAYAGDSTFDGSSASPLGQQVNPNYTTTVLSSDMSSSHYTQVVTITATVAPSGTPVSGPAGWVIFFQNGVFLAQRQVIDGVATLATSAMAVGDQWITATYQGDGIFEGSSADPIEQTVISNSTTTTLVSSLDPSSSGEDVTFTATVAPSGTPVIGPASGWTIFYDNGSYLSQAQLDSSGIATFTTSSLSVGTHIITASYQGDGTFDASWSDPLTQTVLA